MKLNIVSKDIIAFGIPQVLKLFQKKIGRMQKM